MRPRFGCSFTTECEETTDGIQVELTYSTTMEFTFDEIFTIGKRYFTLKEAITFAKVAMKLHNFLTCDIIDATTGEVLVILKDNEE